MITCPTVHGPDTTVGELRAFFRDKHVHMALLVDDRRLVATVERTDLEPNMRDEILAGLAVGWSAKSIEPDASLEEARERMTSTRRRRLAVTGLNDVLLGLLCLRANGTGFCSDEDVMQGREARSAE
jgi:CBS domain-containing protein